MNVLLVAATLAEIQITKQLLEKDNFQINQHRVDMLITGIGGIATTYNLIKGIEHKKPGYIIQAGIAGSFDSKKPLGTTVCVYEEIMGDLGAEEHNDFRDVFDLGLVKENHFPFTEKVLKNPFLTEQIDHGLPLVRSISINEITTKKNRIELLQRKFRPEIESMEGAAFHYVCLCEKIPFIQLRSISNYVGERNKEKWNIELAVENLNANVIRVLNEPRWL